MKIKLPKLTFGKKKAEPLPDVATKDDIDIILKRLDTKEKWEKWNRLPPKVKKQLIRRILERRQDEKK